MVILKFLFRRQTSYRCEWRRCNVKTV